MSFVVYRVMPAPFPGAKNSEKQVGAVYMTLPECHEAIQTFPKLGGTFEVREIKAPVLNETQASVQIMASIVKAKADRKIAKAKALIETLKNSPEIAAALVKIKATESKSGEKQGPKYKPLSLAGLEDIIGASIKVPQRPDEWKDLGKYAQEIKILQTTLSFHPPVYFGTGGEKAYQARLYAACMRRIEEDRLLAEKFAANGKGERFSSYKGKIEKITSIGLNQAIPLPRWKSAMGASSETEDADYSQVEDPRIRSALEAKARTPVSRENGVTFVSEGNMPNWPLNVKAEKSDKEKPADLRSEEQKRREKESAEKTKRNSALKAEMGPGYAEQFKTRPVLDRKKDFSQGKLSWGMKCKTSRSSFSEG